MITTIRTSFVISVVFLFGGLLKAQTSDSVITKKTVDHTAYDAWKTITGASISPNGKWAVYEAKPLEGDGWLYIVNTGSGIRDSVARGTQAVISSDSRIVCFKIAAPAAIVRKAKKDKKKPDDMPKDSLGMWYLETDSLVKWARVKSFQLSENSTWLGVLMEKEIPKKVTPPVETTKKKKRKKKKSEPAPVPDDTKSDGTPFMLVDYSSGKKKEWQRVTEFTMPEKSTGLLLATQLNRKKEDSSYVLQVINENGNFVQKQVHSVKGRVKNLAMDENGKHGAFLSSSDTSKLNKVYALFLKKHTDETARMIVDSSLGDLTYGRCPGENRPLRFSPNGSRLFFGSISIPRKEPKDTLLEEEKHRVDVWTWQDERVMTQQLNDLEADKKFTYLAAFRLADNTVTEIYDDSVRTAQFVKDGDSPWVLGFSYRGYQVSQTWLGTVPRDIYLYNMDNGFRKKIFTNVIYEAYISENGNYILYYVPSEKHWYTMSTTTFKQVKITDGVNDVFHVDNNGVPDVPDGIGFMGWSANDRYVYIYSEYDIWKFDPSGKEQSFCLTRGEGKKSRNRFRNIPLDKDNEEIDENSLMFSSFYRGDKSESFWSYDKGLMNELYNGDFQLQFRGKAKNENTVLFTRSSFVEFPDVWASDIRFKTRVKISNVNPHQSQYKWGRAELVKWKSLDGKMLEGILYKPEDFDSTRKYPMLVYYYERNSDNLNQYRTPRPSASIINPTECVSQDYIVFIPDIEYGKAGDPGKDGYNAIVSGTNYIVSMGFVNPKKIGLQGQSWGGYQTAFMVTQTNMFAAAMAGAPVANMTSAYGGVRWESGLIRAFQYEHGQSRIGKSLWEDREAYIRNSALFYVDKVNTPLLIMHNDADGAVPWYQGIELYNGLRRFQKPVWLLNYNGDKHNLMRIPNRRDLSIRMMQFFNHYLKDAPAPAWMTEGVPAIDKGKKNGYELPEVKQP